MEKKSNLRIDIDSLLDELEETQPKAIQGVLEQPNDNELDNILDELNPSENTMEMRVAEPNVSHETMEPIPSSLDLSSLLNELNSSNHQEEPVQDVEYMDGISIEQTMIQEIPKPIKKAPIDFTTVSYGKELGSPTKEILKQNTPEVLQKSIIYSDTELGVQAKDVFTKEDVVIGPNGKTMADYMNRRKTGYQSRQRILNSTLDEEERERVRKGLDEKRNKRKGLREDIKENRMLPVDNTDRFLTKYSKPTKAQTRLLKSLGLTDEGLGRLLSPKSTLSQNEKNKLLTIRSTRNHRNARYRITDQDYEVLHFIALAKIVSIWNICKVLNRAFSTVHWRLQRLVEYGLLQHILLINMPSVYALTTTGAQLIGKERTVGKTITAGDGIKERLHVNNVLAMLYSGSYNILQLPDFPTYNRISPITGERVLGETIVSEAEITSAMSYKAADMRGGFFIADKYAGQTSTLLQEEWVRTWNTWEALGRPADSPELQPDGKWLYAIRPNVLYGKNFILPDIVIERPRNADGTPNSIAVEVERKDDSVAGYTEKLKSYQADKNTFKKVIYVVQSERTHNLIVQAAQDIQFTNYDIVPMVDLEGDRIPKYMERFYR